MAESWPTQEMLSRGTRTVSKQCTALIVYYIVSLADEMILCRDRLFLQVSQLLSSRD